MIYSGAPLLLISCYMLFIPSGVPDGVYLLIWSALLYTGWTWVVIPYSAWGAELSKDYARRSQVTSVREIYVLFGTLIVVTFPLLIADHQSGQLLQIVGAVFIVTFLLSMPGLLRLSSQHAFLGRYHSYLLERYIPFFWFVCLLRSKLHEMPHQQLSLLPGSVTNPRVFEHETG